MIAVRKPCPNCKETIQCCGCFRNKCIRCGKAVGNITFTVCDKCWDKKPARQKGAKATAKGDE